MFPAYGGWSALVLLAPYLSRDSHRSRSAPPAHRRIAPDFYVARRRQAPVPRHYEVLVCLLLGGSQWLPGCGTVWPRNIV